MGQPIPSLSPFPVGRVATLTLCVLACAFVSFPAERVSADTLTAEFDKTVAPFLEEHCYDCHGDGSHKGGLALDELSLDFSSLENLRTWVDVLDRMESGEMPPKKKPRPEPASLGAVGEWLGARLLAADTKLQQAEGRVVSRRLNRTEYENTVNDLLGIDVRLADLLPEDNKEHGFDNVGGALVTSPVLLERYLEAADAALDAAITTHARPETKKARYDYHDSVDVAKWVGTALLDRGDAIVFFRSTSGNASTIGTLPQFSAPADGLYRLRISAYSYQNKNQPLAFSVHGGRDFLGYFEAPPDEAGVVEMTVRLKAKAVLKIYPLGLGSPIVKESASYGGVGLAVQWVEAEGPIIEQWPPPSYRRIFGDAPLEKRTRHDPPAKAGTPGKKVEFSTPASFQPEEDTGRIVRAFLPRAFRRPVTEEEAQPYVSLALTQLQNGRSFEEAVRVGLKTALCSPEFLFLEEKPGRLDDYALASRLSYFLWSTMPDDELLALSAKGKLAEPATLRAQTERMLQSPKAEALTRNFLGQWLELRQIDFTTPDKQLYPEFDELLRYSMIREVELFFEELLHRDLPVRNFIHSDFSFLNERLARHYGIPGVGGVELQRVNLPHGSHRGGVMTMGAVLKVTANGTGTSPVLRGKWVLDRLLGLPPGPPPKDISAIEPDIRGAQTIREQLDKHRNTEACASCHAKIDPPGFALENFDAIGGWRDHYRSVGVGEPVDAEVGGKMVVYRKGPAVDASFTMADGRPFHDVDGFKALLLDDPDGITRCLTEKLLIYATGAGLRFADRPVVREIVDGVKPEQTGLRSIIHEVVQSKIFLSK